MKICAVICEYNPFHNGHAYQLQQIRAMSGCDKIVCLMSGNFTQRGEAAVLGKYVRARHAVLGGADAVLELPVAFAVSPAELFAQGAVHILSSIPAVTALAFGCESGNKESFLSLARILSREDKAFKTALKENMKDGTSYVRARTQTLLSLNADVDEQMLTAPNNILGAEYCRAILMQGASIEPLPIPRMGAGYSDETMARNFSSATALRAALNDPARKTQKLIKKNVPPFVWEDLRGDVPAYRPAAVLSLLRASEEEIAAAPDCAEGLENRLKALARSNPVYGDVIEKVTTKRYTASRLRRILLQVFLGVRLKDVRAYLDAPLYCRTLALRKQGAEEMLSELARGSFPPLVRRSDADRLKRDALSCFRLDAAANDAYNALSGRYSGDFETLFV